MDKFSKKITKTIKNTQAAVVVGNGFGKLDDLLNIFKTVFVITEKTLEYRAKNLIYRKNFDNIESIGQVNAILVDLSEIEKLDYLAPLWQKTQAMILIEGNDPIGREYSKSLYRDHYRCVELQGFYHIWKLQL
jgi:hypothetical protein